MEIICNALKNYVFVVLMALYVFQGCSVVKPATVCEKNNVYYRHAYERIIGDTAVRNGAREYLHADGIRIRVMDTTKKILMSFVEELVRIKYDLDSVLPTDRAFVQLMRSERSQLLERYKHSQTAQCSGLGEINGCSNCNLALYFSDVDTSTIKGYKILLADMYQVDDVNEPIRYYTQWMQFAFFFSADSLTGFNHIVLTH